MRYFCECFFRDIFSDTSKFTVVKEANFHDALSSCLSLFVAAHNLENLRLLSNQSKSLSQIQNLHHNFLSLMIGSLISCLLLTEFTILFPKEKQASICLILLSVQMCRLEICYKFSLLSIFAVFS